MLREVYWNIYVSMSTPRTNTIGLLPRKAEHEANLFYIGIDPTRHICTTLGALWPLSGNTLDLFYHPDNLIPLNNCGVGNNIPAIFMFLFPCF